MKAKKLFALLTAMCLFAAVFTGCSGSGNEPTPAGDSDGTTTTDSGDTGAAGELGESITVWMKKHHVDSMNIAFEEKLEEISAANDVKIVCEIIAYEDFPQKWAAAIESGELPDLTFMTYAETGQYYGDGLLEDVTDVVTQMQADNGNVHQNLLTPITFENKQYMIPMWTESQIMYWRTDILAAAGYTSAPTTWDEFREVAKAVSDPSKNLYGAGIGWGKGNSDAEWWTRAILWSYGASLVDENGTAVINSDEAKTVAQLLSDMYNIDQSIPTSATNWDDAGNNTAYISGQAAMIFNTGSVLNTVKAEYPDIYENTALAPFPAGPEGAFVPGIDDGLVIFKDAKNKEGAKKLALMLVEKEWLDSWLEMGAPLCLPIYEDSGSSGVWTDETYYKPFIDQIPNFTFIGYPGEYTSAGGEVYNLRIINDTFQKILSGSDTIDNSLAWAEEEINKVYSK